MYKELSKELLSFLQDCPSMFHAVDRMKNELTANGYVEIMEGRKWDVKPGGKYFVTRNNSSIIAFNVGTELENYSFNMISSHTDSPVFKVKENAEVEV